MSPKGDLSPANSGRPLGAPKFALCLAALIAGGQTRWEGAPLVRLEPEPGERGSDERGYSVLPDSRELSRYAVCGAD